jgi:hypothetical protein
MQTECINVSVRSLVFLYLFFFFFPFWALSLPTNYQYIFTDSPTLGYVYTMVPVLMHAVGVGMSILLKVYYDLSDSVGHLEHMAIIIRSRLWLFPGILGDLPVSKRSDLEVQRKKEIAAMAKEKKASSHRFAMVRYLKRCQFPEFRILFRSMESMPWSTVPHLSDRSLGAAITEIAQEDVYNILNIFFSCHKCSDFFKLYVFPPSRIPNMSCSIHTLFCCRSWMHSPFWTS